MLGFGNREVEWKLKDDAVTVTHAPADTRAEVAPLLGQVGLHRTAFGRVARLVVVS